MVKNILSKLRILFLILRSSFDEWKTQVWENDLDGPMCCSGYDCCCQGMTIRELYSPQNQIIDESIEFPEDI